MPKQESFIELKGTMGKVTFYKTEGEYMARRKGGMSRERMFNDPELGRIRENLSEFGGAAFVGKEFRTGLKSLIKSLGDSRVTARVTGVMRKINGAGTGKRGQRSFEMLPNKRYLERLELNRYRSLASVFWPEYGEPTADANRSVLTWVVPDFHTERDLGVPDGATHFQLVLASTVLSDYTYDVQDGGYVPVEREVARKKAIAYSEALPIGGMLGSDLTLSTDLGLTEALPETAALVNLIGVQFFQQVDGELYLLEGAQALQVVNVL
ncbi:MAG TPA: hypothetical protein PKW08_07160 [Flavobacteriaceae bacterium]|nr:hypothetical protein [Flavobacteriaceae bacterium]MCB9212782.1 hypothetical protein [Alteromonas sp.]HPF10052.1 hypothetical protein [Flavobacteriaceae bacterium]HQU21351.1 hypothetical protein [Flavobacteriaceae bacterium]HQU63865.1 hypothetical protein [Flavobacteriaceae bacterium]